VPCGTVGPITRKYMGARMAIMHMAMSTCVLQHHSNPAPGGRRAGGHPGGRTTRRVLMGGKEDRGQGGNPNAEAEMLHQHKNGIAQAEAPPPSPKVAQQGRLLSPERRARGWQHRNRSSGSGGRTGCTSYVVQVRTQLEVVGSVLNNS
jgi:hypothetical protein